MNTIAEITTFPDGTPCNVTSAAVVQAWPIESREGQYGTFTTQNLVVKDQTGEIRVSSMNNPDLQTGMRVSLESYESHGKWQGAIMSSYEKDGVTVRTVRAGKGGIKSQAPEVVAQTAGAVPATPAPAVNAPAAEHPSNRTPPGPASQGAKMTSDEASGFLLRYYTWFLSHDLDASGAQAMAVSIFSAVAQGQVAPSTDAGDGPPDEFPEPPPLDRDEPDDIPF